MYDFLLLGHKGYLGSYLYDNLNCHILEKRSIYNNGNTYQFVINCVGKPNLEYCEDNLDETDYSNALILEDIKKYYPNSKIINFSSYYVYNDDGFCNEESIVTSKYAYCRQKLLGEKINHDGINLRVGKLFGNTKSSQNKLTEHIINSQDLYIDEVIFNPTSVYSILKLLLNKNFLLNNTGTFNFSNDGVTSHFEYAEFIIDRLKLTKNLYKINKVDKSFDNYGKFKMSIEKIKKEIDIENWRLDLSIYLESLKK